MRLILASISMAALLTGAAQAAERYAPDQPQKPVTQEGDGLVDAARTPLKDLNLDRKDIPPVLAAAEANPYDETNTASCDAISVELESLNVALGPDFDEQVAKEDPRVTTGGLAKVGVQALIPFRGAVRYVSGANAHEKEVARAVDAGQTRRGFLKGLSKQMNCDGANPPAVAEAAAATAPAGPPPVPNIGMTLTAPAPAAAPPAVAEPTVTPAPLAAAGLTP